MIDKVILFSVCLVLMRALSYITLRGCGIVILVFILLEAVKEIKKDIKKTTTKQNQQWIPSGTAYMRKTK